MLSNDLASSSIGNAIISELFEFRTQKASGFYICANFPE
jgi:hypothetical protein